jgi:hypothetical protein
MKPAQHGWTPAVGRESISQREPNTLSGASGTTLYPAAQNNGEMPARTHTIRPLLRHHQRQRRYFRPIKSADARRGLVAQNFDENRHKQMIFAERPFPLFDIMR